MASRIPEAAADGRRETEKERCAAPAGSVQSIGKQHFAQAAADFQLHAGFEASAVADIFRLEAAQTGSFTSAGGDADPFKGFDDRVAPQANHGPRPIQPVIASRQP